ncbi:MAG: hypothetical protein GWP14_02430 [Actinobacteria bacterium]|nr:hypothetical protein [Actinomycetota bacterium]
MEDVKIGFLTLCAPVHVELIDETGHNLPCCGWAEMAARSLEEQPDVKVVRYPKEPLVEGKIKGPQVSNFNRKALIVSREQAFAAFEKLRREKVDCVVLFFSTWMWVGHYIQAIRNSHLPIILWGVPRGQSCNTVGLSGMHGTLQAIGLKHGFVYGLPGEEDTTQQVLQYARSCYAVNKLSRSKYGKFGSKSMDMVPSIADDVGWMARFGVDIEHMDEGYLIREAKAVKESQVKSAYALLDKYCAKKPDLDSGVDKDLRVYVAMKKIKEKHQLDFMGVKCVFEMGDNYISPCLAQGLLGAEGIASTCCSDDNGVLTGYIMGLLAKAPVFQADVNRVDRKTNEMVMLSCGTAPLNIAASPKDVELPARPELEGGTGGVCVVLQAKPGPATLARISRVENDYVCHLSTGQTFKADKKLHAQCGFPSMPHAFVKLDGDPDKFIRNCYSQYIYLIGDNIANEMRLICDHLNMTILED